MSNVIISRKKGEVYHEPFCPYVNYIGKKEKRSISEEKAINLGYRECKFCHSVRGISYNYRKNTDYCVSYDPVDDALCVRTDAGFWKLIWRDNIQRWHLFHMNHHGWHSFDPKLPSRILARGSFHRQSDFSPTTSVDCALHYIYAHDKNYGIAEQDIRKMPKNTKKQRSFYNIQKNRKKREGVREVYRIFDELKRSV